MFLHWQSETDPTMNTPPISPENKSWRVRKIRHGFYSVSPGFATLGAAQTSAKLFVDLHALKNIPAMAHVIASIAEPQIKL